jgi:hypothetical protein
MSIKNKIETPVNKLSEFKISQKVSSFKYEPLKNAKSFTVHPYYVKYLNISSEKIENIKPIQNKLVLKDVNILNKLTSVNLPNQKVKSSFGSTNINIPVGLNTPITLDLKYQETIVDEKDFYKKNENNTDSLQSNTHILNNNNLQTNDVVKENTKLFEMGNEIVFYPDINNKKYSNLVEQIVKPTYSEYNSIVTLSEEELKKQELEKQELEKQELEKQELEKQELEKQELEKQRQLEIKKQEAAFVRKIDLELERQELLKVEKENKINELKIHLEYIESLRKNKEDKQKQFGEVPNNNIICSEKSYITSTIISKPVEILNNVKKPGNSLIKPGNSLIKPGNSLIKPGNSLIKPKKIPLVTIIVPMYNVELYIKDCIISLLNQSYGNIEIILVDDYSIDNTKKIADEFGKKYPLKIKVIPNQKNMGTYKSINNGIVNSSGDYITIIGSDDQFTINKVEEQANILTNHLKYVACFCEYKRVHYKTKSVLVKDVGESTIMFRRTIIEKIGYYDSVRFGADSEYRDRIKAVYGKKAMCIINAVLYLALFRPNSLISSGKSIKGSVFRVQYRKNYLNWHTSRKNLYMAYPLEKRPFKVANELL